MAKPSTLQDAGPGCKVMDPVHRKEQRPRGFISLLVHIQVFFVLPCRHEAQKIQAQSFSVLDIQYNPFMSFASSVYDVQGILPQSYVQTTSNGSFWGKGAMTPPTALPDHLFVMTSSVPQYFFILLLFIDGIKSWKGFLNLFLSSFVTFQAKLLPLFCDVSRCVSSLCV